jgi:hypothetical protein
MGLLVLLGATPAAAQWRTMPSALAGIDHIPFVVHDLQVASTSWRNLGFTVKDGSTSANGIANSHVKFEDGSGIELLTVPAAVDDQTRRYREMLDVAEGPALFSLQARDLAAFAQALDGSPYKYGTVSRTFEIRDFDYLFVTQDNRAPDDKAYTIHPNGAKALSRVWIATTKSRGRRLRDLLVALGGDLTLAKVYAPEAVQGYDVTISNGEVLILPASSQLTEDRPIIGATFEVEDLDVVRRRLDLFQVPWTMGGTEDLSVIVAPEATHGMWVEFRE